MKYEYTERLFKINNLFPRITSDMYLLKILAFNFTFMVWEDFLAFESNINFIKVVVFKFVALVQIHLIYVVFWLLVLIGKYKQVPSVCYIGRAYAGWIFVDTNAVNYILFNRIQNSQFIFKPWKGDIRPIHTVSIHDGVF